MSEQLAVYRQRLAAHDWHYEYADGMAWRKGQSERMELQRMQARIDPDFAVWNELAPEGFKRSAENNGAPEPSICSASSLR